MQYKRFHYIICILYSIYFKMYEKYGAFLQTKKEFFVKKTQARLLFITVISYHRDYNNANTMISNDDYLLLCYNFVLVVCYNDVSVYFVSSRTRFLVLYIFFSVGIFVYVFLLLYLRDIFRGYARADTCPWSQNI